VGVRSLEMTDELRIVTTVGNETEATIVSGRLSDAGIRSMRQPVGRGVSWGVGGAQNVYVQEEDLQRAREILNAEVVSEEELVDEEERAERADAPGSDEDAPENPFGQ
jgi:hypothetical protein